MENGHFSENKWPPEVYNFLSPSGQVRVALENKPQNPAWNIFIDDKLVSKGRGADEAIEALDELASQPEEYGQVACDDMRLLVDAWNEEED